MCGLVEQWYMVPLREEEHKTGSNATLLAPKQEAQTLYSQSDSN
jgi:hypothetical protein